MKRLVLVAATIAVAACSTTGPGYQAASDPNSAGYFVAPAEEGRHAVTYTGSRKMSSEQVAEFALLRAAELTLSSGQEWFAVIEARTRNIEVGDINSIQGRSGSVLSSGSITAGAGGGGDTSSAAPGVGDGAVPTGPSTGGFGGGDVPYQVIERWTPPTVPQTTILIQMGSGNQAAFDGLAQAPEIYSAKAVAEEIRAKMAR